MKISTHYTPKHLLLFTFKSALVRLHGYSCHLFRITLWNSWFLCKPPAWCSSAGRGKRCWGQGWLQRNSTFTAGSAILVIRRPPRWKDIAVSEGDSWAFFPRFSEAFMMCLLKHQTGLWQERCYSSPPFRQTAGGCDQCVPGKASAQLSFWAVSSGGRTEFFKVPGKSIFPWSGRSTAVCWSPSLRQGTSSAGNPSQVCDSLKDAFSHTRKYAQLVKQLKEVFFGSQCRLCLALCFGNKVLSQ